MSENVRNLSESQYPVYFSKKQCKHFFLSVKDISCKKQVDHL